ncbi:MAG: sugar ABC transporter ATP-binding protein [Planctomycetes bacterium]|nr:sugar ABC transporter ATP-binding protein [Planctomycetota bacterium]
MTAPAVRFNHVTKRFPGVLALDDVSLQIEAGRVHALCGENGAGKSTLGKLLAGIHVPDGGSIELDGRAVRFASPREALRAGVGMVHQELAFCENLSVAENLCLEDLPRRGPFLNRLSLRASARNRLATIGADIDVDQPLGALALGQRQLVQIAAAVGSGARVIVFDEPTSSLSRHETEKLLDLIRRLREHGVTSVYVSHRMEEIFEVCDTVSVLRDGKHVASHSVRELAPDEIVRLMIGRQVSAQAPRHLLSVTGQESLHVEQLSSPGKFNNVSFALHAGEVLGVAGLIGAGRSEVAEALFGLDPRATGKVSVLGAEVCIRTPGQAMQLGMGFVPEDRKRQGLVLALPSGANVTLPLLRTLARAGWIRLDEERSLIKRYFDRLRVRAPSPDFPTAGLSGGNQQKLVLAKWLATGCRILILDEPTRGVDVGAKAEIHALIDSLACEGLAVLLISSELPEIMSLSTRILVLREGRIVAEIPRAVASQELLLRHMTGVLSD